MLVVITNLLVANCFDTFSQNIKKRNEVKQSKQFENATYQIIKEACIEKNTECLVYAFVRPEFFDSSDLTIIGNSLSKRYTRKNETHVFLFDDLELARRISKSKVEIQFATLKARGLYYSSKKEKYIKYSKTKSEYPWETVLNLNDNAEKK